MPTLSDQHKQALAEGRRQARAVRAYLEALASRKPGRPVSVESLQRRLLTIEADLAAESDVLRRLELTQARLDVTVAIEAAKDTVDMTELERDFVSAAKPYGERKGVGYAAWRQQGVPAAILRKAGIKQTRSRRS